MKKIFSAAVAATALCVSMPAFSQEHYTEGPVWECSMYRIKPGQYDNYMKFIRSNAAIQYAEAKKQGLLVDYKFFEKPPRSRDDWDFMTCMLQKNFAAYDYDKAVDEKWEKIMADRLKTADRAKQMEMTKQRFEMRDFIGTIIMREEMMRAP